MKINTEGQLALQAVYMHSVSAQCVSVHSAQCECAQFTVCSLSLSKKEEDLYFYMSDQIFFNLFPISDE